MITYAEIQAKAAELGPLLPVPEPTMRDVSVGWSLWEKMPDEAEYFDHRRGGVVVHVTPGWHPDTGEAVDRYVMVHVHRDGLRWLSLRADELAAAAVGRPNNKTIQGICTEAARQLVKVRDVEKALELWSLGARLMAVLARPGTAAP